MSNDNQSVSQLGEQLTAITPVPEKSPSPPIGSAHLLDQLAELWASHRRVGLEARIRTGKLLNEHLGDPTTRQKRGMGVLKQAADRLKIAVSELSRMRHFAHRFESLDNFAQQHGSKTWTDVKALLTKREANKPEPTSKTKDRKEAKLSPVRCRKQIDSLTKQLDQFEANGLSDKQIQGFAISLKKFAEVARTRLSIVVTVGEVQEREQVRDVSATA